MSEDDLLVITAKCTKEQFSCIVSCDGNLLFSLQALRRQLSHLQYFSDSGHCVIRDYNLLTAAFNHCPNISAAYFPVCSLRLVQAFASTEKKHLISLHIRPIRNLSPKDASTLASIIGTRCGKLTIFHFLGRKALSVPFREVITAHKDTLKFVTFIFDEPSDFQDMVPFYDYLMECPNLENVSSGRFSRHLVRILARKGVVCHGQKKAASTKTHRVSCDGNVGIAYFPLESTNFRLVHSGSVSAPCLCTYVCVCYIHTSLNIHIILNVGRKISGRIS